MSDGQKEIPINKYSVYELKAGLDKEISEFFLEEDFDLIEHYSNIKIFFGLLTCLCTGTAYLLPIPFPQNYYIILFSVIGYVIFSTIYWYVDKKVIDTIFFVGRNDDYFYRLRPKKGNKVVGMVIHSDIDMKNIKKKHIYKLWFDFIFEDKQSTTSDITEINCTDVYDERGYIHSDKVIKHLKNIIRSIFPKI